MTKNVTKKRKGKLNASKKNSILNFVAVGIIIVLGLVLSFCSFELPNYYTYNGFFNSISLGLDLSGGVSIVYQIDSGDDDAVSATITRIKSVLSSYSEANVTKQGSDKIRVEVPNVDNIETITNLIGTPTSLYMSLEDDLTITDGEIQDSYDESMTIIGSDISRVGATYNQDDEAYGVTVIFTDEGGTKFADLTQAAADGDQIIYVYIGDDTIKQLKCEQQITGGSTFISGSFETYEEANEYALQLMSGTFSAKISVFESSVVSATLGANALKLALIAGIIGIVLVMFVMWLRYGDFGLLADVALVIYLILMMFFLQAISFVQLTLPGLAGIILSFGMAVDGNVIIFERIRDEYKKGRKLSLASKSGFKRAFWPIFDSNITTIITSIILYILGTASIKGFAITLLIGILLSMFTSLVISRFLVKWYLPFNETNGKKIHVYTSKVLSDNLATESQGEINNKDDIVSIESGQDKDAPEIIIGGQD